MNRKTAFLELKQLAVEATTILGERRAAMIAGCHTNTMRPWVKRPFMLVHSQTIDRVLPRLRGWHRWVAGYVAEVNEVRQLEMEFPRRSAALTRELRHRLEAAAQRLPMRYLACGCEVMERDLLHWLLGRTPQNQTLKMAQALGRLRHLDSWPQPPVTAAEQADRVVVNH